MSKHTPGPWNLAGVTVYALHGDPKRNRFSAAVQTGREDDASLQESLANARLMASAPELLEACIYSLDFMNAVIKHDSGIKDDLRRVIAKAQGATQ